MKFALIRNDEIEAISVGFCKPFPPKIDESVWVGSLSSRDGWITSCVMEYLSADKMHFRTMNNDYHLVPLEEYYHPLDS